MPLLLASIRDLLCNRCRTPGAIWVGEQVRGHPRHKSKLRTRSTAVYSRASRALVYLRKLPPAARRRAAPSPPAARQPPP